MNPPDLTETLRFLQTSLSWSVEDVTRVAAVASALAPRLQTLADDLRQALPRDPAARRLLGDDLDPDDRLQRTLAGCLDALLSGRYDPDSLERRWRASHALAEIGLPPTLPLLALSRLRSGMVKLIQAEPTLDPASRDAAVLSLSRLLDLELALIQDAYHAALAQRLQRHERLATLGQIAGGIAHELRNPLNVIATSCDYLSRAQDLPPEKRDEHLDRIERQVAIGENVIRAITQFAHMPEPAAQPVSLDAIIDEAMEVDPPPAGITVRRECADPCPRVLADRDQLRIALGNILRNAYEAIDGPGLLVLAAEQSGDVARLRVTDSGPGISPEVIPRLTDPLYSGKPRGLGLGLAISKTIVERHLGMLDISSLPGQGTTVTLTLPAAGDLPPASPSERGASAP